MAIDVATNVTAIGSMPSWWPDNLQLGAFFFFLGILGAGIVIYFGGLENFVGKSKRVLDMEDDIYLKKVIADKIVDPDHYVKREIWEKMIDDDNKRLDKEWRSIRIQNSLLYLFIGGGLAAILAKDMTQAVAVGAGWTGILGVFGIKANFEEKLDKRNKIDEVNMKVTEEKLKEAQNKLKEAHDSYKDGYSQAISDLGEKTKQDPNVLIDILTK